MVCEPRRHNSGVCAGPPAVVTFLGRHHSPHSSHASLYRVQLDQFEGPLDLLLFFIRRDELDIYDIPVAQITDEFLGYVRLLEQVDLDGAAEFIYMAAVLISIKARMLLPRQAVDEDGEPIDPRAELVDRLLQYIRYKEAATQLELSWNDRHELMPRGAASSEHDRLAASVEVTYRVSVFDLMSALQRMLEKAPEESAQHTLPPYEYTIDEQRTYVREQLALGNSSFVKLVENRTKPFVIVTFLAILEMLQRQVITLVMGITPEDFAIKATVPIVEGGIPQFEQPPDKVRDIELESEVELSRSTNGTEAGS